jgi:hypothetical protein
MVNLAFLMTPRFLLQRAIAAIVNDKRPHAPLTWGWLNREACRLFWTNPGATIRPQYAWGSMFSAALAKALGHDRVALLELGVAGGTGLVALQTIAAEVSKLLSIQLDVYGFDTGAGLPQITDPRDMPQLWQSGDFKMDHDSLRRQLTSSSKLILGDVRETLPAFLASPHAPIGFLSIDVDLYTATRDSLVAFRDNNPIEHCLPRVVCYADDIMATTMAPITGERLAIEEYNKAHYPTRCISPIYGLRYDLDWPLSQARWPDMMFWAHFLDHPRYGDHDGLRPRTQHLPFRT